MTTETQSTDTQAATQTNWREDLGTVLKESDVKHAVNVAELDAEKAQRESDIQTKKNAAFMEYLGSLDVIKAARLNDAAGTITVSGYIFKWLLFAEEQSKTGTVYKLQKYKVYPVTDDERLRAQTKVIIKTEYLYPVHKGESHEDAILRQKLALASALRQIDATLPGKEEELEARRHADKIDDMARALRPIDDDPFSNPHYEDGIITIHYIFGGVRIVVGADEVFWYEEEQNEQIKTYRPGNWEEYLEALYNRLNEGKVSKAGEEAQQRKVAFTPCPTTILNIPSAVEKALAAINTPPATKEDNSQPTENKLALLIQDMIAAAVYEYHEN